MTRPETSIALEEEWRSVVGYEDRYEVSSFGRVRSVYRESPRLLRPGKDGPNSGRIPYFLVNLSPPTRGKSFRVHLLVAEAFLGPRPLGMECSHEDGDSTNNAASNLAWRTRSENHQLKRVHGTMLAGERHHQAKLTAEQVRGIRALGEKTSLPHRVIAGLYEISRQQIQRILSGENWKALLLVAVLVVGSGGTALASYRLERADGSAPVKGLSIPATLVLADVHWPVVDAPPKPRAVKVAPAVYRPTGGVWDRLAACESGGRWHIATGNGYHGGLQFSQRSWAAVGGKGSPAAASRSEQIHRAEKLKAVQGWGAWPSCSRKLGLR